MTKQKWVAMAQQYKCSQERLSRRKHRRGGGRGRGMVRQKERRKILVRFGCEQINVRDGKVVGRRRCSWTCQTVDKIHNNTVRNNAIAIRFIYLFLCLAVGTFLILCQTQHKKLTGDISSIPGRQIEREQAGRQKEEGAGVQGNLHTYICKRVEVSLMINTISSLRIRSFHIVEEN